MDPATPGAYEWWYFDALSDDSRWAVVVIFFLGTPMSPYYRAVARGGRPDPRDWCGVFLSLHENLDGRWRERVYAYNLYRGAMLPALYPRLRIGGSSLGWSALGKSGKTWTWLLDVNERGLWRGGTQAALSFRSEGAPPTLPPTDEGPDDHTWVLVAPQCRVDGTLTLPEGQRLNFHGRGYHDHNFGRLPFADTNLWYWGRARLRGDDAATRDAVFYHLDSPNRTHWTILLLFDADGTPLACDDAVSPALSSWTRNGYGLEHATRLNLATGSGGSKTQVAATLDSEPGVFAEGPFYRRLPLSVTVREQLREGGVWTGSGEGIGEVFRPAKLCGPLVSRAMWSRIRRRKA